MAKVVLNLQNDIDLQPCVHQTVLDVRLQIALAYRASQVKM